MDCAGKVSIALSSLMAIVAMIHCNVPAGFDKLGFKIAAGDEADWWLEGTGFTGEIVVLSGRLMFRLSEFTQKERMKINYDLSPTTPLRGIHLVGTVRRRFLVSYPVEPEILKDRLPPGGQISTHDGQAWISACFVDLPNMRPSGVPSGLGAGFYYLIHRTRARLPYPDGSLRESVLILEANMNNWTLALLARLSTGIRFRVREINLVEKEDGWELSMIERGTELYQAFISKSSIRNSLPSTSLFSSVNEADDFLLGVSYGGEWKPQTGRLRLLAETHDSWKTLAGRCDTARFDYLEKLGVISPQADHVITMTDIPHYFALQGVDVICPTLPETARSA